jgi:hypothetical protein
VPHLIRSQPNPIPVQKKAAQVSESDALVTLYHVMQGYERTAEWNTLVVVVVAAAAAAAVAAAAPVIVAVVVVVAVAAAAAAVAAVAAVEQVLYT